MRAGGDREQKPAEDGWKSGEMHDRARARPAITPLSLSPGQPVSCERIRRQAQVETLRRVTAPRLPVKPSDRDTVAQVQRVQISSRTHTHMQHTLTHAQLSSLALCISLSSPFADRNLQCPSLYMPLLVPIGDPYNAERSCFSSLAFPSSIFSPSASPAAPLRRCRVPAFLRLIPIPSLPSFSLCAGEDEEGVRGRDWW